MPSRWMREPNLRLDRLAYRLSRPEMDELQAQLWEMLKHGFIERGRSPWWMVDCVFNSRNSECW